MQEDPTTRISCIVLFGYSKTTGLIAVQAPSAIFLITSRVNGQGHRIGAVYSMTKSAKSEAVCTQTFGHAIRPDDMVYPSSVL